MARELATDCKNNACLLAWSGISPDKNSTLHEEGNVYVGGLRHLEAVYFSESVNPWQISYSTVGSETTAIPYPFLPANSTFVRYGVTRPHDIWPAKVKDCFYVSDSYELLPPNSGALAMDLNTLGQDHLTSDVVWCCTKIVKRQVKRFCNGSPFCTKKTQINLPVKPLGEEELTLNIYRIKLPYYNCRITWKKRQQSITGIRFGFNTAFSSTIPELWNLYPRVYNTER